MNRDLLLRGAAGLGVPLSEEMMGRFALYHELLQRWGERMNLTAVRDSDEVVRSHFLDSLALVSMLGPLEPSMSIVDVGSGAGFPGFVCLLAKPDLRLTVVEKVQKKAAFLMTLRRELGLTVEILAQDVLRLRRQFQLVVSRAAFPPDMWLRVASPLVAEGGALFWMLSARQELPSATAGLFQVEGERTYELGGGPRHIFRWRRMIGPPSCGNCST